MKTGDEQKVTQKSAACHELAAPVAPNTPCGSVSFYLGEKEIGRVGLVVSEPVPELSTVGKMKRYLGL